MARKIGNQKLLDTLRTRYDVGPKGLNGVKGWYVTKEQEKIKNMKEIIDALSEAILATGKKFEEIPKDSIISYLDKVGVNRKSHDEIYQKLTEIYKPKVVKNTTDDFTSTEKSNPATKVVSSTTAKTKERQPRKNVFSEITKIH
jgi:hypothetical protein